MKRKVKSKDFNEWTEWENPQESTKVMTGVVNRSLIHSLGALYYSRKSLKNLAFKTVELCNVEGYSRHSYTRLSCGCGGTHGNSLENGNDS